jgi:hypothetical protein
VFTVTTNEPALLKGSATLRGKRLATIARHLKHGRTTITVKLGRTSLTVLRKALAKSKRATVRLSLTFTDAAGLARHKTVNLTVTR